ncbi:Carbohydrate esterase family 8 protein [Mycena chlorophos]|uniref:Carbohydrate esterase family 8 protein n=1 Tax=Mycena chlorophos TaxID=658473 RepID=A0A8H6RUQ9_MYCCL|nr:Carbohydrate esterase family 8 protein [Mycena chlorophos]
MSAPFVFVPEAEAAAAAFASSAPGTPQLPPNYYGFGTPGSVHTPFLPPSPLIYNASPAGSVPGTPSKLKAEGYARWPGSGQPKESAYGASWAPLARPREPQRQRTSSLTAPPTAAKNNSPPAKFLSPTSVGGIFRPGHQKSKSSGNVNQLISQAAVTSAAILSAAPSLINANGALPPPWVLATPPPLLSSRPSLTHPWLDAEFHAPGAPGSGIFRFDLAVVDFRPECVVNRAGEKENWKVLGRTEHVNEAFFPPRFGLRIVHPELVWWPVVLRLPDEDTSENSKGSSKSDKKRPPITLGDVLASIHHSMHSLITQDDWAALSPAQQSAISTAFTSRCRAEALRSGVGPAQLAEREQEERSKGLKRVDFLCGKTIFRGLKEAPDDSKQGRVLMLVTS